MQESIVLAAVKLLENCGVKFTIDDLKNELKISKKTIYKYFSSKHELAKAVFDYIISKSKAAQNKILDSGEMDIDKIILCLAQYMRVFRLQSEKIFNLYSLNSKLTQGVQQSVDDNWRMALDCYKMYLQQSDARQIDDDVLRLVVEGIFKNIYFMPDSDQLCYKCLKSIL